MISSSKVRHLRLVINVLYYFLLTRCTLQPSTLLFYILDLQRYMYSYMGTLTDLHRGSMWNQWFQTGQSWCHFPQSCWTKTSTTETFTKYRVLKNNVQILVFKITVFFLRKWQLMSWNIYWYELIIALKLYHLVYPPHNTVISCLSWCFLVYNFCHTPYKHLV